VLKPPKKSCFLRVFWHYSRYYHILDKEAAHGEFAVVCREIVVFFVDDGLVGLRDPIWLQGALKNPFQRVKNFNWLVICSSQEDERTRG
jgi:hypothetical protein